MDKKYVEKLKKLNPAKLKEYYRKKKQRYRERKKKEENARRSKEIDHEMKSGNLNFPEEKDKFMSWLEWKRTFPNTSMSEFLRAKMNHKSKKAVPRDRKMTGLIGNIPIFRRSSLTCIRIRKMQLGIIPYDAIEIQNHPCKLCQIWYAKNKRKLPVKWRGFDLFHGEEESRPTNEENQETLREVMEEHFKDKYNEEWVE